MSSSTVPSQATRPMPEFVREALDAAGLADAYDARPAYQRNDYIRWISRASHPADKENRLSQMLDELGRGDVYMHANWRPQEVSLDDASAILGLKGRER